MTSLTMSEGDNAAGSPAQMAAYKPKTAGRPMATLRIGKDWLTMMLNSHWAAMQTPMHTPRTRVGKISGEGKPVSALLA